VRRLAPVAAILLAACNSSDPPLPPVSICFAPPTLPSPGGCADGLPATNYPLLESGCRVGVDDPRHLVITTTDFSTGAVSVATTDGHHLVTDVALGSNDAMPFYHDGLLYLVHRHQLDFIDVVDPCDGFASRGQFPLSAPGVTSANPNSVAFRDDGLAFVPLFAAPRMAVIDFSRPHTEAVVGHVDTSAFADDDGNPEASLAIGCGDTLFINARRLDPSFKPVDRELLFAVDAHTCKPYDTSIELHGTYVKKARLDPGDPSGRTLLLLTTGVERVDLVAGTSEWALSDSALAAVGVEGFQVQAFDITMDGRVYLAAYNSDFTSVDIWRGQLDQTDLERVATGLNAVEGTLEIIGDELWFGDTTPGHSGLRVFDLTSDPPELIAGPLSTGLPPYTMIAVP